jgi:hypothetical protein
MKKFGKTDNMENWLAVLMGVFAILAIKSIFENDSSKIVSSKGRNMLSDEKKMQDINNKILESEGTNSHKEIVL